MTGTAFLPSSIRAKVAVTNLEGPRRDAAASAEDSCVREATRSV